MPIDPRAAEVVRREALSPGDSELKSCFTSSGTIYYILVWAWSVCIERLPLDKDYLPVKRKVNN